jgi:hypothetical protein
MMYTHCEDFVQEIADSSMYVQSLNEAAEYNLSTLREKIDEHGARHPETTESFARLIRTNRIYAMARRGFELQYPGDPQEFREEPDIPYRADDSASEDTEAELIESGG